MSSDPTQYAGVERRWYPRIDTFGVIHGLGGPLDGALVIILDMSVGGFSMQTDTLVPVGTVHEFRLMSDYGAPIIIPARVVRSS